MKRDPIRDHLKRIGASEKVIEWGLEGLVENWEHVVDQVAKGYPLDLDSYLNDLDSRQLIQEVLSIVDATEHTHLMERIAAADLRMKTVVIPARECLWGDQVALDEGWNREQNWWYFNQPKSAGPELLEDLERRSDSLAE